MNIATIIDKNILFESICIDSYAKFVQKLFAYPDLINTKNDKGETLLHFSCLFGMIDKYYALINMGAVASLTNEGNNLLHYASVSGKDNFIITQLVKTSILPTDKNIYNQTSLHMCANEQIAHYLNLWCNRNKIDVTKLIDNEGNNVAHGCMLSGHEQAAFYWIKNYPQLNLQKNKIGNTWNQIKTQQYNYG